MSLSQSLRSIQQLNALAQQNDAEYHSLADMKIKETGYRFQCFFSDQYDYGEVGDGQYTGKFLSVQLPEGETRMKFKAENFADQEGYLAGEWLDDIKSYYCRDLPRGYVLSIRVSNSGGELAYTTGVDHAMENP